MKFPEENLPLLYTGILKIKGVKFRVVQDLASKYVPPNNLWFYKNLVADDDNDDNYEDY